MENTLEPETSTDSGQTSTRPMRESITSTGSVEGIKLIDNSEPFKEHEEKSGRPSMDGQMLWQHAKGKVMAFVDFSMSLHTLRDHTAGKDTLDPKKLKLICRLGSAYTPSLLSKPFHPLSLCRWSALALFCRLTQSLWPQRGALALWTSTPTPTTTKLCSIWL